MHLWHIASFESSKRYFLFICIFLPSIVCSTLTVKELDNWFLLIMFLLIPHNNELSGNIEMCSARQSWHVDDCVKISFWYMFLYLVFHACFSPTPQVRWYKEGHGTVIRTHPELVITNASHEDAGRYYCQCFNSETSVPERITFSVIIQGKYLVSL